MIITKLEPYNSKTKVYIDNSFAFVLYKGEIRKYKLSEGGGIDDALLKTIHELLYKRGKERALYLLDSSYKTEKYIVDKLKAGFYPDIIIDKIIAFLKEYDLVNDERYALMYIEYKIENKSIKQIKQDLFTKGISKNIIDDAISKSNIDESASLNKLINKRIGKYDLNNIKDVQKLYNYLLSKGYSYDSVKKAVERASHIDIINNKIFE